VLCSTTFQCFAATGLDCDFVAVPVLDNVSTFRDGVRPLRRCCPWDEGFNVWRRPTSKEREHSSPLKPFGPWRSPRAGEVLPKVLDRPSNHDSFAR
jgi:hypothetical protein